MTQGFIAMLGLAAVYMSMVSQSHRARRWAPVVGLCAQPFWLYATGVASQWGMFTLSCAFTAVYIRAAWLSIIRGVVR